MLHEFLDGMQRVRIRRWLIATGVAAVALASYCGGRAQGKQSVLLAQIQAQRDTVMDTVRVVEQRLLIDTVRMRETAQVAKQQRAAFDSAARVVERLAETEPTASVAMALPAIHVCEQAVIADSLSYRAVVANLSDMTKDRDAQRRRAEDDERLLAVGKSRFGFRSGVAVGVGLVALIVHVVR